MFLGTDDQRIVRFRQAKEGMGTPLQGFPNAQPNFTRRALMQGIWNALPAIVIVAKTIPHASMVTCSNAIRYPSDLPSGMTEASRWRLIELGEGSRISNARF
jgi:hypothetical protein